MGTVNEAQKKIMIAISIGLVIAFLIPPHAFFLSGGGVNRMGYAFIANIPYGASVHLPMLFAEWIGIVIIGGIFYFIARDTQLEYTPQPQSNLSNDTASVLSSRPADIAPKKSTSWGLIWSVIVGVTSVKLFGPACGILTIGAFYWLHPKLGTWRAVAASGVFGTVAAVSLTYWLTNSPTQSAQVQTQSTPVQQSTSSRVNSPQEIFQRANNLYNQGRYTEALPLYQRLATYSGAQLSLGEMYENGKGITKDTNQAVYWYRMAAEIGDENAKDARAALNKLIAKEKKTTPHEVQPLPSQAQQTRSSNTDEYVPPKIPGDTNNDGILSGSEQYLRDHH